MTVAADMALPLRTSELEAGLAALYHQALRGAPGDEVRVALCRHLARLLNLRLALLARSQASGAVTIEAASTENGLWLELQRIPECWDDGVASHGPAGQALRAQSAVRLRTADEGFALWRTAAEAERVGEVLALPLATPDGARVLEFYLERELERGASAGTLTLGGLARRIESFLADLREIERMRLLSSALASAGNAALITDLEGTIVWSNPAFTELTGYGAEEVRGRNPRLLSSGQQGLRYYRDLWSTIRSGRTWSGETVDRGKDGRDYTIRQTVSPVSQDGRITHYLALQQDIERQKQERLALERATRLSPQTGLMTPAAFEDAANGALTVGEDSPLTLVVLSLRGLQRASPALTEAAEEGLAVTLGRRLRESLHERELAGGRGAFEYTLLLREDGSESLETRLRTLAQDLAEPLPDGAAPRDLDAHFGCARFPQEGTSYRELWLRADRRLADEPHRRARRDTH